LPFRCFAVSQFGKQIVAVAKALGVEFKDAAFINYKLVSSLSAI
jgi:hypothetical protein